MVMRIARVAVVAVGLASVATLHAATLAVTTIADPSVADGACSLREAIASINAGANQGDCVADVSTNAYGTLDRIDFNIAGPGVRTIALASSLPDIAKPMTINGYSQPGASANANGPGLGSNGVLLIEIDATNVTNAADTGALTVGPGGGGTTIQGLVINRYVVNGIALVNSGGGNVIQGNYIGINAAGTAALTGASSASGIEVRAFNGGTESGDIIGNTTPATRNVIAGNNNFGQIRLESGTPGAQSGIQIFGNFIGTNAAGTASLSIAGCASSAQAGVRVLAGWTSVAIGAAVSGAGNLISGNCARGVSAISDPGMTGGIDGNFIGTDVTGTVALGNQAEAIELFGVGFFTIRSNVISAAINTASNGTGIDINGVTGPTLIQHNMIGTDFTGTQNLGNQGAGIVITNTNGVQITGSNVIAFNGCCQLGGQAGIEINSGTGNAITGGNVIFSNQKLGIDLAPIGAVNPNNTVTPANNGQNYPVISSAVAGGGFMTIQGTLDSVANASFLVEFYANPACDPSGNGQGQSFLGSATVATDGSGHATFNTSFPLFGGPAITATATKIVSGIPTDTSEFSACVVASGTAAPTTTALVSSVNPSTVGQSVTFTATVTGSSPTGTIQFKDGATNLGSPVTLVGGVATLTTSALAAGTHPITAVYGGDANNLGSTSNLVIQVVNAPGPVATTTTLTSSLNPSLVGQSVTFTAHVAGSSPTGTVQFRDGATNVGGPVTLAGGAATLTTSALAAGTHPITAAYGGDSGNLASTSSVVNQMVNVVPPVPPPTTPIPTLGAWALALMTLLLALAGGAALHRRRGR